MVATYNGKVIAKPPVPGGTPVTFARPQSYVDEIIAADKTWQDISSEYPQGPTIDLLVYDDRTPVNDYVLPSEVPGDADFWIVSEPAFYFK